MTIEQIRERELKAMQAKAEQKRRARHVQRVVEFSQLFAVIHTSKMFGVLK